MMKYELLAIFPGTLSEEEVSGGAGKIKEILEKHGAASVVIDDMGKSRLAYPMKHIRYGYFRLYSFEAEPKSVPTIQEKISLSHGALRAIIRKYDPKSEGKKVSQIMTDVAIATALEEGRKERESAGERTHEEIHLISKERKAPEAAPEVRTTTVESIQLGDIDKKLDELLESDLTKV